MTLNRGLTLYENYLLSRAREGRISTQEYRSDPSKARAARRAFIEEHKEEKEIIPILQKESVLDEP